jgi:heme-degrading monooxygenase HmoA
MLGHSGATRPGFVLQRLAPGAIVGVPPIIGSEASMFARVSTYRAADADQLLKGFESLTDAIEQTEGFSHALFLVDRTSGKAMSITVWESEQALTASVAKADEIRKRGAEAGGATIESVEHYEIGLTVGGGMDRVG